MNVCNIRYKKGKMLCKLLNSLTMYWFDCLIFFRITSLELPSVMQMDLILCWICLSQSLPSYRSCHFWLWIEPHRTVRFKPYFYSKNPHHSKIKQEIVIKSCLLKIMLRLIIHFTAENRSALRELEAMSKLIDFVAHPEWNDLHVMAVMVLSNLLEDIESLEVILSQSSKKTDYIGYNLVCKSVNVWVFNDISE